MHNAIAVWSVDGGPDYQVPLVGESSFISYKLSTNEIDFGEVSYWNNTTDNFYIENIGKVPFEFSINLSTITRPGMLEVSPMNGKIMSGERFRVVLKFKPGIPDNISELFLVEWAHFPAERFKIKAVGIYPGVLLTLPRHDDTFNERFDKTKKLLDKNKIKYDAKFTSSEVKVMTTGKGKQDKFQMDFFQMDIESETDRLYLWEKLLEQQEIAQARTAITFNESKQNASLVQTKKAANASQSKAQAVDPDKSGIVVEDEDKIVVSNYIWDFGNMVVGSSKKRTFRMTNCGKNNLGFSFDTRILQQIGIIIDPIKPPKIFPPNTSMQFTVTFATRKNAKHGKVKHLVPVNLSYGPSYNIEFVANMTIPELSMSTDSVEFNQVWVGTRKIIKVRFENKKEVSWDWWYYYKPDVAGVSAKEGEKFSVYPVGGQLLPGQKQTVDVIFTPTHEKIISQNLQFKWKENSKIFTLNVKGHGINYALDIIESSIEMGPVLPYDKSAVKTIDIKNPMSFPIEVYSSDFDKQYLEEEEILKRFELLNEKDDLIFEKLRKAGHEFWPNIKETVEKKKQYDEMVGKAKAIQDQIDKEFVVPPPEEGKEPKVLSEEKKEQK